MRWRGRMGEPINTSSGSNHTRTAGFAGGRKRVGARNPVVPGHTAFRYSWISPSHRLDRRGIVSLPGDLIGVGTAASIAHRADGDASGVAVR